MVVRQDKRTLLWQPSDKFGLELYTGIYSVTPFLCNSPTKIWCTFLVFHPFQCVTDTVFTGNETLSSNKYSFLSLMSFCSEHLFFSRVTSQRRYQQNVFHILKRDEKNGKSRPTQARLDCSYQNSDLIAFSVFSILRGSLKKTAFLPANYSILSIFGCVQPDYKRKRAHYAPSKYGIGWKREI